MSLTIYDGSEQHLVQPHKEKRWHDMAFLTGCHGAADYDDYDGDDDDDIDIADQPTQPIERPLAALAIASAQMQILAEREAAGAQSETTDIRLPARLETIYQQRAIYGTERPSICTICAMDLEEKMRSYLITDGALLLVCDYHIEQIRDAKDDDSKLELYANLLHLANLRYSWPPGE